MQELFEIGQGVFGSEGFVEAIKYAVSSSNPLIKSLYELSAGKEIFTGREIGDPAIGKMGYGDYLAKQFRPYREYGTISRALKKEDFDAPAAIARFAIGGRVQTMDTEKLEAQYAYQAGITIKQLRHQIGRRLAAGDEDEARELSAELVDKYRRLFDIGVVNMVPRKLRAQFMREQWESTGGLPVADTP